MGDGSLYTQNTGGRERLRAAREVAWVVDVATTAKIRIEVYLGCTRDAVCVTRSAWLTVSASLADRKRKT